MDASSLITTFMTESMVAVMSAVAADNAASTFLSTPSSATFAL
jgi:hypothetical protein